MRNGRWGKEMKDCVTVVCCYNDGTQYDNFKKSLTGQTISCKLLGIDNRGQRFSSCAAALNSVAGELETEYVIYSHQDIELPQADMLERFVDSLCQLQTGDILGVAGAVKDERQGGTDASCVISDVRHGAKQRIVGDVAVNGIMECDTVDECFFGGRTETFRLAPFDEKLCNHWHLYAVERCLHARCCGHRVFVCGIPLIHTSKGHIDHAYNVGFLHLAQAYHKEAGEDGQGNGIGCIRTVCGSSRTDWLHRTLFYWKRELLIRMNRYSI